MFTRGGASVKIIHLDEKIVEKNVFLSFYIFRMKLFGLVLVIGAVRIDYDGKLHLFRIRMLKNNS